MGTSSTTTEPEVAPVSISAALSSRYAASIVRLAAAAEIIADREELSELEEQIKNIEELLPKGMIFWGPPGTGKNTLLRQLAASIKTVDKDGKPSRFGGGVSTDGTTVFATNGVGDVAARVAGHVQGRDRQATDLEALAVGQQAVDAAARAWPEWRSRTAKERAAVGCWAWAVVGGHVCGWVGDRERGIGEALTGR